MAAAARHNPADARIPCPLCGGLIHPIAGRCKHCKADLQALRSARPAAVASLPSLAAASPLAAPQPPTYTHAGQNGHAVQARGQLANGHAPLARGNAAMPVQAIAPNPAVRPADAPILPPRPTGRMPAEAPQAGWWRHWPLLVIGVAGVAIVVAVILMAVPPASTDDPGVKTNSHVPAPERMDTSPLVPNRPAPRPAPDIDIPDDPDVADPGDPGPGDPGDPGAGPDPSAGMPPIRGTGAIALWMMRHVCDRAQTCANLSPRLQEYCREARKWPLAPPPASCTAARRCFERIDEMSCAMDFSDITALTQATQGLGDCIDAMQC